MKALLSTILVSFIFAEQVVIHGPAEFTIITIEDVYFENDKLKEWNQIQQKQIDYLLGREKSLTWMTDYLSNKLSQLANYTLDVDAGNNALANIDFGSISAGHFAIGVGFGFSNEFHEAQSTATGIGIKYNFGDIEIFDTPININGISKGWTTGRHSGGGFGFTFEF